MLCWNLANNVAQLHCIRLTKTMGVTLQGAPGCHRECQWNTSHMCKVH